MKPSLLLEIERIARRQCALLLAELKRLERHVEAEPSTHEIAVVAVLVRKERPRDLVASDIGEHVGEKARPQEREP